MPHFMDGDWRSFVSRRGDAIDDRSFHLVIDPTTGVLLPGSTHDGATITGEVVQGRHFHHVFFNKSSPARAYRGILVLNGLSMVLCGHVILNFGGLFDGAGSLTEEQLMNLLQQVNEVWIATKP